MFRAASNNFWKFDFSCVSQRPKIAMHSTHLTLGEYPHRELYKNYCLSCLEQLFKYPLLKWTTFQKFGDVLHRLLKSRISQGSQRNLNLKLAENAKDTESIIKPIIWAVSINCWISTFLGSDSEQSHQAFYTPETCKICYRHQEHDETDDERCSEQFLKRQVFLWPTVHQCFFWLCTIIPRVEQV